MEKEWIEASKEQPRRLENVWITRKNKVELAYLDIDRIPQWHLLESGKSVAYNKVNAWMPMSVPKPYTGSA